MNGAPSLSAIVLAGGQSSRMGQDKALISIDGVPLLRRVCDVALQCTPQVYVVTPNEQYREILPNACHLVAEKFLSGEKPHGPLVGFAQGLTQVQTDWVLLLACDLPHLSAEILQNWAQELNNAGAAIALLPKTEKGWEPLCGFYRPSCLPSLTAAVNQGERSFQRWLAQAAVKEILFSDSPEERLRQHAMLFNCNTPVDLKIAKNKP
jgi:molybdopterin-guanine dinucleotide biosynthesis protein A